ncbi:MAG TPA: hypothetical protein VHO29_04045 [Marmoricola sp.]|nr:hypothetical protein [Marmoricola sp.]
MTNIPTQRTPAEFLEVALGGQGPTHFPNVRETDSWAARIRREFAAVGFTVEGLSDDLKAEQAGVFLRELLVEIGKVTA